MSANTSHDARIAWKSDLFLLTIGFFIFYLLFLGHYPVFSPDESRYSEIAREMLVSGDYITPRVNGIIFLDKPILHYWLQTRAMLLLGVNEWAFRIIPVILAVLCNIFTYITGRLLFNRQTGLIASLILATSPLFFIGSHYANLDLEVAALISISLLSFIASTSETKILRLILLFCAYASCSLAVLTKGLIGIAFPMMIIGSWIALTSQWKIIFKLHLVKGLSFIFLTATPWYLLAEQMNPGFFQYFFIDQQLTRFTSSAHFNNPTPFWFYGPIIFIGMIPWSCLLPQAFKTTLNICFKRLTNYRELAFLLLWVVLITIFFSIPQSKTVTYILPIFPACALLIAYYLTHTSSNKQIDLLKCYPVVVMINIIILLLITFHADKLNTKTLKPLIMTLKHQLKKDELVINYYKHFSDVPLYLEKPVLVVNNWDDKKVSQTDNWAREFWIGKQFQNTDQILINDQVFLKLWGGKKRVYVFVGDNFLTAFKSRVNNYHLIDHDRSRYYLFSNQKNAD